MDGDGEPESFDDPDFNSKQFRSNTVLRWEYSPGSRLFAVWSHGRRHFTSDGEFSLGDDIGTLFESPPENVFMIKLSHWVDPYAVLGG